MPLYTATKLSKLLHDVTPVSSSAVVVTSAFLSFIPGIPYVEPCYTSCIIQSYNDEGDWRGSVGEKKGKGVEDERDSEEYRRWIWERCCPGTDYEGNLPHPLEVRQPMELESRPEAKLGAVFGFAGHGLRIGSRIFRYSPLAPTLRFSFRTLLADTCRLHPLRERRL